MTTLMGHFPYFNHLFAENIIRGGGQKRRKSAEKGHFIPFFSILKGPEGRRGFNSAISYITTVISTSFIYNHSDFDLFFISSFEKVTTFSKMELKNKSKSLCLLIIIVEIFVVIYEIAELNPLRPSGLFKIEKSGIKWPLFGGFSTFMSPPHT